MHEIEAYYTGVSFTKPIRGILPTLQTTPVYLNYQQRRQQVDIPEAEDFELCFFLYLSETEKGQNGTEGEEMV